ncbi:MAG: threonylcarbamoyl-AMP synthase [bacterium]|nr:threonylcarbamoyl-AMP synthase [Candidatus Minthenecus merdequi]
MFDKDDLRQALLTIRQGGVVLYPTDTVWGLGCDATNTKAVSRIYEIKRRAESKALILLVDSVARIQNYVVNFPDIAYDLLEVAVSPTTIIYDKAKNLPENIVADDGSIAIRVTAEKFSNALCSAAHVPLVSTSANVSNEPSPSCFGEISPEIINAVDYVVKFRQDDITKSKPSSIIKLGASGQVQIIR